MTTDPRSVTWTDEDAGVRDACNRWLGHEAGMSPDELQALADGLALASLREALPGRCSTVDIRCGLPDQWRVTVRDSSYRTLADATLADATLADACDRARKALEGTDRR